jgi:Sec7-like guanine-nucleotide exchange factor
MSPVPHHHHQKQLQSNVDVFSEDTVYILSFSLIMLNTDLHNPNIAENKKMTMDGFVRNNKGINNGKDMPRELLEDLFRKIKTHEIKMNEGDQWEGEVVTFMAPNKSGWLDKMNHSAMRSSAQTDRMNHSAMRSSAHTDRMNHSAMRSSAQTDKMNHSAMRSSAQTG